MTDNTCITCGRIIPEGRHICLHCERQNEMQRFSTPNAAEILSACSEIEALIADADIEDKNLKSRLMREIAASIGRIRRAVRK